MKKLKPLDNPFPVIGCYSIDLYCMWENPDHEFQDFPHSFIGSTYGNCAKDARANGWIIHRSELASCPKCAKVIRK